MGKLNVLFGLLCRDWGETSVRLSLIVQDNFRLRRDGKMGGKRKQAL